MWNFYMLLVDAIINDKGVLDECLHVACVPLANYINKSPDQFRDLNINGYGTCLEIMIQLI
jgi:hypothetical protein